jgi:hypothetical protein
MVSQVGLAPTMYPSQGYVMSFHYRDKKGISRNERWGTRKLRQLNCSPWRGWWENGASDESCNRSLNLGKVACFFYTTDAENGRGAGTCTLHTCLEGTCVNAINTSPPWPAELVSHQPLTLFRRALIVSQLSTEMVVRLGFAPRFAANRAAVLRVGRTDHEIGPGERKCASVVTAYESVQSLDAPGKW